MWEIEFTDEFEAWWVGLEESDQENVRVAIDLLEEDGLTLRRPLVDTLEGSRYANMKELRPLSGNIGVLFAFEPRRTAILLIGGDKTGRWRERYEKIIPVAG